MALGVQIVVEAEQQDQRSDPASTALRLIPSIGTPQRAKTLFAEGRIIHSRRDQVTVHQQPDTLSAMIFCVESVG